MTADCHGPLSPASFSRRTALQAGSVGLLGLGTGELNALQAALPEQASTAKSVLFVFLTGGLSHLDSFDMKPHASETVRGEYQPIATRTTGLQICEHLPLLAERSERYALVRSVATESNSHEVACHMLLTGRLDLPPGFKTGDAPDSIHVILAGAIEVVRSTPDSPEPVPVAYLSPGEAVGDMGLFTRTPRPAHSVARLRVRCRTPAFEVL